MLTVAALALASCGSSKSAQPVEEPSVGVSLDGDRPIIMRRGLNGLQQGAEEQDSAGPKVVGRELPIAGTAPMARPKGLLYRMSGNYADKVPVQMGADGQLISFPAPSDIPANPEPIRLIDGWYLSPVGVSANSVFTRWTYAEYRRLTQTPSVSEIREAIIPGAKVTMTMSLPMTASEAIADTTAVNEYIMANQIMLAPAK